MNTLADIYNNQQSQQPVEKKEEPKQAQINLVLHMPEMGMLVRHLDLLYSKMIINQQQNSQQVSYFNPGQGSVKQSDQVA